MGGFRGGFGWHGMKTRGFLTRGFAFFDSFSGPQKGPTERGHVKNRQKYFRHFSTCFAQGKKRQKSSKSVKNIFDTFRQFSRGTSFPAPFGGPLTLGGLRPDLPFSSCFLWDFPGISRFPGFRWLSLSQHLHGTFPKGSATHSAPFTLPQKGGGKRG